MSTKVAVPHAAADDAAERELEARIYQLERFPWLSSARADLVEAEHELTALRQRRADQARADQATQAERVRALTGERRQLLADIAVPLRQALAASQQLRETERALAAACSPAELPPLLNSDLARVPWGPSPDGWRGKQKLAVLLAAIDAAIDPPSHEAAPPPDTVIVRRCDPALAKPLPRGHRLRRLIAGGELRLPDLRQISPGELCGVPKAAAGYLVRLGWVELVSPTAEPVAAPVVPRPGGRVTLRFLEPFDAYNPDELATFSAGEAEKLLALGVAEVESVTERGS